MKAPVGLLSDGTVCVSRWRGFAPTSSMQVSVEDEIRNHRLTDISHNMISGGHEREVRCKSLPFQHGHRLRGAAAPGREKNLHQLHRGRGYAGHYCFLTGDVQHLLFGVARSILMESLYFYNFLYGSFIYSMLIFMHTDR